MLRTVSNPPNPWAEHEVEWLGEPPPVRLRVFEEDAREILSRNDSPDVPFTWSVNPYRGCQHACAYCYARPSHQLLGFGAGTDFDSKIVVKRNAPALLGRALRRTSWDGDWIAFSGVTDPYQPLEASYRLTRACLEACRDARNAVGVVTKGALVRRDAELLAEIERVASASVFVSIPFADAEMARAIEPWAGAPATRFETLRVLAEAGVPVGVSVSPAIPGLNDSQIPEILERAREAGARRAFLILLRLPAEVRPVFEERLRAAFPDRAARVLSAIEDARRGQGRDRARFGERMRGRGPRWRALVDLFELHARRLRYETWGEDRASRWSPRRAPRATQGELFE